MAGPALTHREFWTLLGVSEATFYRLKRTGVFDHLATDIPRRYSRVRAEAWLAGVSVRDWRTNHEPRPVSPRSVRRADHGAGLTRDGSPDHACANHELAAIAD